MGLKWKVSFFLSACSIPPPSAQRLGQRPPSCFCSAPLFLFLPSEKKDGILTVCKPVTDSCVFLFYSGRMWDVWYPRMCCCFASMLHTSSSSIAHRSAWTAGVLQEMKVEVFDGDYRCVKRNKGQS